MFQDLPDALRDRAAAVRLAVFDVDGVLTDGRLWYAEDQRELKAFHVHDGLGLKRLLANGIEVAIITARMSHLVTERMAELGVAHVYQGQKDKLACLRQLCEALQLEFHQVCYTGDDLPDLRAMRACGLMIAPANAHHWVAGHAHWQTRRNGGEGAVRRPRAAARRGESSPGAHLRVSFGKRPGCVSLHRPDCQRRTFEPLSLRQPDRLHPSWRDDRRRAPRCRRSRPPSPPTPAARAPWHPASPRGRRPACPGRRARPRGSGGGRRSWSGP